MGEEGNGRVLRFVRSPRESQPDALADLAREVVAGDARAVRTLLVAIAPSLLRVVRKVLGPQHPDVDDVTQESAYAVLEALPRHRGECSVLHFACRIGVLTAMTARRRESARKRASTREADLDVDAIAGTRVAPEVELDASARAQIVRELLDTLPREQADVLALHCVLGYTMREIADASNVPLETVRSRFRLAKQAIRSRVAAAPELLVRMEEM